MGAMNISLSDSSKLGVASKGHCAVIDEFSTQHFLHSSKGSSGPHGILSGVSESVRYATVK